MTGLLTRLLGRLPVGLLQLTHNHARFIAALAGVAFANVLVFAQLGLAGAMYESIATPYRLFAPDVLLVSPHGSDTLTDTATLPRQRLFQALVHPDITAGTPVFLGSNWWLSGQTSSSAIQFIGLDAQASPFVARELATPLLSLSMKDTVLVDMRTRFVNMRSFAGARPDSPLTFEIGNRQLSAIGATSIGGGFGGDGVFIVSDQTFLQLFPRRSSAAPNHILLKLRAGADASRVAAELTALLPPQTVRVRPLATAMTDEQQYQMTKRPTGLIFAFGVAIGVIVGIVIAYQVLNSDVADHMREYATFKAMGYRNAFFVGIIMEEAIILAAIGFWPGLLLSQMFYASLAHLTNIPIFMTTERAVAVFFGTIAACAISGVLAMRKLAGADPADLF